jgi:predicted NBD/HSP70 family sugar kinase
MGQGSNSSTVRQYNERVVISALRKTGAASKADLSRMMGLTLPALTRIVDELEQKGLIEKSGRRSHGVGQPSNLYQINNDGLYSVGIKLGRQNIEFVLANFSGKILEKKISLYDSPSPSELLDMIQQGVDLMTGKLDEIQRAKFVGVGIAMPWFMGKWSAQKEMAADIAALWDDLDFAKAIEERIKHPIFFENDCSAAAAAELYFGNGKPFNHFLYIYIGTFVGGGLVLNGDLERGIHSNAACLASIPVPGSSLSSGKTNGAWDTLANRASITTLLAHLNFHQVNINNISELPDVIDENRSLIHEWMVDCADSLVFTILSSIGFLDLETVIIDSELPPYLLSELVSMTRRRLDSMEQKNLFIPQLQQGSLGEDAIAIGGAILPLYSHFAPDRTILLKGGVPDRLSN